MRFGDRDYCGVRCYGYRRVCHVCDPLTKDAQTPICLNLKYNINETLDKIKPRALIITRAFQRKRKFLAESMKAKNLIVTNAHVAARLCFGLSCVIIMLSFWLKVWHEFRLITKISNSRPWRSQVAFKI